MVPNQTHRTFRSALALSTVLGGFALLVAPALADDETDRLAHNFNQSGLAIYETMAREEAGNLVISPYGIGTALAMAYSGASGDTKTELAETLGFSWSPEDIGVINARLRDLVTERADGDSAEISLANGLALTSASRHISQHYIEDLSRDFSAELFRRSGVAEINSFVSKKTNGRIQKVLDRLDPMSVAVLINAVHFSATWDDPFSPSLTTYDDFHLTPLHSEKVETLHQDMAVRTVTEGFFQAAALPFAGGALDLIMIMPRSTALTGASPSDVGAEAFLELVKRVQASEAKRVALSMPKFSFDTGSDLVTALKSVGLTLPFDETQADFRGMSGDQANANPIHISSIRHQALIAVDETGAEAAAATAVEIGVTSAMPRPLERIAIDRPFHFAIADRASGTLLFVGRVADPREGLVPQAVDDLAEIALDAAPDMPMLAMESAAMASAPSAMARFAGGGITPGYAPGDGDQFATFSDGRVLSVADEPVSTFSVDVDTAAYSYVRRLLTEGALPQADAVRVEEMINYFDYGYDAPDSIDTPFAVHTSLFPTPWRDGTQLLSIGIQGFRVPAEDRPPANIVLLIDTSGSMNASDKLPLLKKSFELLLGQLSDTDTVAIVAYAGSAGVVLPPTPASDKTRIRAALNDLTPGGSTAGAAGIELAYQLAEQAETANGTNRVILATDGDFNVGIDDPDALKRFIAKKREGGVSLSVLGFGSGNLDDATMQALAQNGDGTAAYIDSFSEAKKVLADEVGASLLTIARDVKVQVEFNSANVAEYRLIGYETRALNNEDFNNDAVDAGDIGSGHAVTALYEITPTGSAEILNDPLRYAEASETGLQASDEIAFVKLRFKPAGQDESELLNEAVLKSSALASVDEAADSSRFVTAVAAFGQKLRDNPAVDHWTYAQISDLAQTARGLDEQGYRAEFIRLVNLAGALDR